MQAPEIHLEAAYLPRPQVARPGFTVFRVDLGTLWRFDTSWNEIPIPEGKVWFSPDGTLKEYRDGQWEDFGGA